jgi:hypothetical protein
MTATVARALGVGVLRQFDGGAFGAFHVRTAAGQDAVLKVLPDWPEFALHRVKAAADIVHGLTLEIANSADPTVFRANDVVHGDFHPGNVLIHNGQMAAVIDWESAQPGDCRADLIRMYSAMATWSHPGATLLKHELDRTTPPEVWHPIAAELVAQHLRYGLLVQPSEMDWVLREAEILLGGP